MEFSSARKRTRNDYSLHGNGGGPKRSKQDSETFPTGVGSKSKPCTKFFSFSGCQFGETCHFLHYVPGGYKAVSQMINLPGASAPSPVARAAPPPFHDSPSPGPVKSRICKNFNSKEGCRFGDKCHFAHGEWELGKPSFQHFEEPRGMGAGHGRMPMRMEPPPHGHGAAASFGAAASAKVPIEASLAGAIIGKGGVHSKNICRATGARLFVRDHESDPNKKNIELEGTIEQIGQASNMVKDLIMKIDSGHPPPMKNPRGPPSASNFKTKICDNFSKGTCTFGDRCHFAHGAEELRSDAAA
ncbi:Zinc finger CCCH domain-containing protein [Drosera capensis]